MIQRGLWQQQAIQDVARLLEATQRPYTAAGIEQSGIAFDTLAAEWSPTYQEQRHPLLAWIAYAREALGQ